MSVPKDTEAVKQIHYLAAALKAPRITDAAVRLADQARDAGWSFEGYLAAVLEREVSARNASGAESRIKAAGFPARKTLEDFDWDAQPTQRQSVAALASGRFLTEARNIVLLGPPGTGKTHLPIGLGIVAARHGVRVLFATATDWVTRLTEAHRQGRLPKELARLRRYGLIIVDEVGYLPFEQDAANLGVPPCTKCLGELSRNSCISRRVIASDGRSGSSLGRLRICWCSLRVGHPWLTAEVCGLPVPEVRLAIVGSIRFSTEVEKAKSWWADPWLRVLQLSSAVCTVGALACWFVYMVLEDRPLGEWITPLVALGSLGAALWARHTASVSAGIAKSDAQRRRYGWEIELQPKGKSYLLRNIGTVAATNVRFGENEGFSKIKFRHEPSAQRIEHSEAREFYAFASWGSQHQEIQISWVPEDESEERTWTSAITIAKDEAFEDTLKERRDTQIRSEQNAIAERREWTNRLISLGAAYSEYMKNSDDPGNKIRVQLLVASLPPDMAIEIGRQVDVARDLRQSGPDLVGYVPDEEKHLIEGQSADLELIWNIMRINGSEPSEGHSHRTEYNIWDVGPGAVTRIQRRMSGQWPTRYTHEDRQKEEEGRRIFAEMEAELAARRQGLGLPDPIGDDDADNESPGTD